MKGSFPKDSLVAHDNGIKSSWHPFFGITLYLTRCTFPGLNIYSAICSTWSATEKMKCSELFILVLLPPRWESAAAPRHGPRPSPLSVVIANVLCVASQLWWNNMNLTWNAQNETQAFAKRHGCLHIIAHVHMQMEIGEWSKSKEGKKDKSKRARQK